MSEPLSPRQRFQLNQVMKPAEALTGETSPFRGAPTYHLHHQDLQR